MTTAMAAEGMGSESEEAMDRVAISILRDFEGLCASMDERFGRAKAFLVVDKETGKTIETIENTSGDASHGAGTAAANLLRSAGVSAVVSGRFGPNALDALRAVGIEAWVAPRGVNAGLALLMLEGGRLERMESFVHR
jgi:predicted Fe-Mo cluster-binding NifX family protein